MMIDHRAFVSIIITACLSLPVAAIEYSAVLSSNAEFSTNISLSADDTNSDTHQTISLSGSAIEERKTFQTNASFTLEKDHYYGNAYEGETTLSTGLGLLNFDVVEEFLSWQTSFTRSQTLNDPLEEVRSDNLGYRDTLSSGPSILYVMSPTMMLVGGSSYIIAENSQRGTADTKRAELSVVVTHQISSITSMNWTGAYEVMLDADGGEKYDRIQLGVGVSRQFVDGVASISVGRTHLVPEANAETESNFVNLSFVREKLWLHDVTINFFEDISDSSIGFAVNPGAPNQFVVQGNDIVRRRSAGLSIDRELGVYGYSLALAWDYEDYSVQNSDEKVLNGLFALEKEVFPGFSTGASLQLVKTKYLGREELGEEELLTYQINGNYQFSPDIS
ncbi:hypothetical protein, partial [Oleiphilus sp. HI0117]